MRVGAISGDPWPAGPTGIPTVPPPRHAASTRRVFKFHACQGHADMGRTAGRTGDLVDSFAALRNARELTMISRPRSAGALSLTGALSKPLLGLAQDGARRPRSPHVRFDASTRSKRAEIPKPHQSLRAPRGALISSRQAPECWVGTCTCAAVAVGLRPGRVIGPKRCTIRLRLGAGPKSYARILLRALRQRDWTWNEALGADAKHRIGTRLRPCAPSAARGTCESQAPATPPC
jgi:hypothetical protein